MATTALAAGVSDSCAFAGAAFELYFGSDFSGDGCFRVAPALGIGTAIGAADLLFAAKTLGTGIEELSSSDGEGTAGVSFLI